MLGHRVGVGEVAPRERPVLGGAVGQELLREGNTTGSKGNDAAILQDVLAIKEELERIREQVEKLE